MRNGTSLFAKGGPATNKSVEAKMTDFMRPIFGDMAARTIESQKEKLKYTKGELSYEQYAKVVDSISELCHTMAGNAIAGRLQKGLMAILDAEKA